MTSTTEAPKPFDTAPLLKPWRAKSGWSIALGVVYVITGCIALGSVVMATLASVLTVGLMMLIAGVAELANAFQARTWGRLLLCLLLGALYIIAGYAAFRNPLLAAAALTLVLGIALLPAGIVRITLAFLMDAGTAWTIWIALSGLVTILVGLVILAHWPVSSLYVLGVFLGVDLVCAGAGWIALGLGLRRRLR